MNHIQQAIVKTIPQLSGCYCGSNDTLFDMAYEMADYHLHEVIDTMERLGGPETSQLDVHDEILDFLTQPTKENQ